MEEARRVQRREQPCYFREQGSTDNSEIGALQQSNFYTILDEN
jgi:hypothetical protein